MTLARRHYSAYSSGDTGDIAVRDDTCSNDHELLADHDPQTIARELLTHFSIEDVCASAGARQVVKNLNSPKHCTNAFNAHFGRNAVSQATSFQAKNKQSQARDKAGNMHLILRCVDIADPMTDLGKTLDDD